MSYAVATIGYKSVSNILRAVEEAYASSLAPDEFVVVINPYRDDNVGRMLEYVRNEERITRWALLSQNIGCAKAFNMGFSMCESDYVVALSDDCSVGPETYEGMISGFDAEDVGIVGVVGGGREGDAVTTAQGFLLTYRRDMVREIGGYDEIASPLADEREFGLRAAANGWKTNIVGGLPFHHIHDISNNPMDNINYMGEDMSPKGVNPFQHVTQEQLDYKSHLHNEAIRNKSD